MEISKFIEHNYRHFNAAALRDAARGYVAHIESGGGMIVTLGGAASTAEIGLSLAEMIRQDKVHAISCTGANLEEDIMHLISASHYERIPNWRYQTPDDDHKLCERNLNRVTDTAIPELEAFRTLEGALEQVWDKAHKSGVGKLPHEFIYEIIKTGLLKHAYDKDPKESWVVAAAEKNIPMFVPGFEDSTTGNLFSGRLLLERLPSWVVRAGTEYMVECIKWYTSETKTRKLGMMVFGGGISADFVQCVVPLIIGDFRGILDHVPTWDYLCQIGDSTTSYGSFSGCFLEKISWKKISKEVGEKRAFAIESDATIVAPLIFAYVLGL